MLNNSSMWPHTEKECPDTWWQSIQPFIDPFHMQIHCPNSPQFVAGRITAYYLVLTKKNKLRLRSIISCFTWSKAILLHLITINLAKWNYPAAWTDHITYFEYLFFCSAHTSYSLLQLYLNLNFGLWKKRGGIPPRQGHNMQTTHKKVFSPTQDLHNCI